MINIKGKEYMMVNERIKEFRIKYPGYSLISEIIQITDDSVVMKASVVNDKGVVVSTGFAREERQDKTSLVNLNAYVENCETSAWGRALGNLGIGIDVSIASGDEMNIKMAHNPETLDDFKQAIESAKSEKQLGFLYYRWSEKFKKGTVEYEELQKLSSDKKIAIGNPTLKVG